MTDHSNETLRSSPDFRTELANSLRALVPEAVLDGKVDIARLQELLGEDTADEGERFGLFWPGKKRALRRAQEPTSATLKPVKSDSKNWDATRNVFIEGDNLEVLKILQKQYHNKVKMIYIDPPYNTGKDFIYPDNYKDGLQSYLEFTRQVDEEGKRLSTNSESEGRYHSNWLNMMYPRLKLARNLLTDDGVIFISIDDNEVSHLRKLCDEVFGEDQFAAQIIWKKRNTPPNDRVIGAQHDYILAYVRKDLGAFNLRLRNDEQIARYKNPDNHAKGPWVAGDLTSNVKGGRYSAGLNYPIANPRTGQEFWPANNGNWRFNKQRVSELILSDEIYFGKDDTASPKLKRFLADVKEGTTWTTLWDFAPFNTSGSLEMQEILGSPTIFDSPKPVGLIELLLKAGSTPDCIVLDFFAGSGTTAHAVMELNAEDGGNRQYIQVQLPEPTSEESEARKAGFATIAEISRRRINIAGGKIEEHAAAQLGGRERPLDTGYRAYKLSDSNCSKWRVSSDIEPDQLQQRLVGLRDSSNDDAAEDELLTEILLKQGFSLSEEIVQAEIGGLPVWVVGDNKVLAFLNESLTPSVEQLRQLAITKPGRIVILEDALHGDDQLKTNFVQICKTHEIELWTA